MRTLSTDSNAKKAITVETPFSDAEAIEKLALVPGDFARGIREDYLRYRGKISHNRICWAHKLVVDKLLSDDGGKPQYEQGPKFDGISQLFKHAAEHKCRPWFKFALKNGGALRLSYSTAVGREPRIYLSNGKPKGTPESRYYGFISPDGVLQSASSMTPEIKRFLGVFDKYPGGVTSLYGRLTSRCIFCRLELTDERSLLVGYGPVCADNHGLPWGERPEVPLSVEHEIRQFLGTVDAADDEDLEETSGE